MGNMLHATWGVRCFMQTALRRKTETGNEKDPSAALGMTKRERHISHSFSLRYGSQPPALRATSFQRKKNAVFPVLSFRAPARNLFRLRSGETVREADNGKHRASSDKGSLRYIRRKPRPVSSLLVLISGCFFPRRSSPVIMDRD